jgi:hypothetical protein
LTLDDLLAELDALHLQVDAMAAKLKVPPSISGMTVSPDSLPVGGGSVTVNATVSNATRVLLDGSPVTLPVTVNVSAAHQFTLTAHGKWPPDVTATASVTVAQATPSPTPSPSPSPSPGPLLSMPLTRPEDLGPQRTDRTQWNDPAYAHSWEAGDATSPVIDDGSTTGVQGLRFDKPSQTGANWGGAWGVLLPRQFGPASMGLSPSLFVQLRIRWNDAMMNTFFVDAADHVSAQAGLKAFDLAAGGTSTTNEMGKIVLCTPYQHRFFSAYTYMTPQGGADAGILEVVNGGADYKYQNDVACLYSELRNGQPSGCFYMRANEWVTMQVGVDLLGVNATYPTFWDWRYRLWMGYEGQPQVLLHDFNPQTPGYFPLCAPQTTPGIGKVFIFPYMTRQDPAQVHDLARVWFRDLVVSESFIADPPAVAPVPPSSTFPAWRVGKPVGTLFSIFGTANLSGAAAQWDGAGGNSGGAAAIINAWGGLAASRSALYSALGGGHGDGWSNAVIKLDLLADAPAWTVLNAGSAFSAATTSATGYYMDGLPCSRHTYYTTQYVPSQNRLMMIGAPAPYPNAQTGTNAVDGFSLSTNAWDAEGHWTSPFPSLMNLTVELAAATHPTTSEIFAASNDRFTFAKWSGGTWQKVTIAYPPTGAYPASWVNRSGCSLIDATRNKWVTLVHPSDGAVTVPTMQRMDCSTYVLDNIALSGAPDGLPSYYGALCHDTDNDRYMYCGTPDGTNWNLYAISPTSGATTLIAAVPSVHSTGLQARMAYLADLGGVAILPQYSSNVLFLPTR